MACFGNSASGLSRDGFSSFSAWLVVGVALEQIAGGLPARCSLAAQGSCSCALAKLQCIGKDCEESISRSLDFVLQIFQWRLYRTFLCSRDSNIAHWFVVKISRSGTRLVLLSGCLLHTKRIEDASKQDLSMTCQQMDGTKPR